MDLKMASLVSTLAVLSFCQPDNATSALQQLESMPQCGVSYNLLVPYLCLVWQLLTLACLRPQITCVLGTIPQSNCSITDVTCTCTDEWFINTAETCVASSCNVTDALSMASKGGAGTLGEAQPCGQVLADNPCLPVVARTNADICNTPRRSKKNDLIAVVLLCALALFANVLRLYSRWYLNSKFDVDDWIMLAVAVLLVPYQTIGEYGNYLAFGVDTWYVPPDDLTNALQVRNSPFLAVKASVLGSTC